VRMLGSVSIGSARTLTRHNAHVECGSAFALRRLAAMTRPGMVVFQPIADA
jgi:hypothetical protein